MVSDAENTTNRKRPERLQQKTRVRSRSPAVTHSIYGNIHSRERIKSQERENAELPKPPRQHGEYHSDSAQLSERRFRPGAVRPRGYARPSRLRPPRVDHCQPTALRLDPPNTRRRLSLSLCCRISRVV